MDINDKDSLEINDITYTDSIYELDETNKKAKIIEEQIEEEIKNIEISHKKVLDEITSSFEKRRLELDEKEKLLKSELDIKVNEIKNELNNSLKELNKLLLCCEKITQAKKNIEEKIESKDLIKFYYISEIKKKEEEMKNKLKNPIKSVDISYNTESNNISYNEYFFSGIPIPKDIKYEIIGNKLRLSWNINKYKIKNFINTFYIHIKVNNKENIYTSIFNDYLLDKYEINVEYEVKIRSCIDNHFGDWSEIIKFKIDDFKDGSGNNNNNLFLFGSKNVDNNKSFGLFGLKSNENVNQKSNNIFNNLNMTNNLFNNPSKEENSKFSLLFSSNNNQIQKESLFKNSLFGNNNEKINENKASVKGLFSFSNDKNTSTPSLFNFANNEKKL